MQKLSMTKGGEKGRIVFIDGNPRFLSCITSVGLHRQCGRGDPESKKASHTRIRQRHHERHQSPGM
jgi:hypothetical protein